MPQPVEKVQLKLDSFDRLKPAIFMAGFVCAFFYLLSNPKEVQYALPDCHIARLGRYYRHGYGRGIGVIVAVSAAVCPLNVLKNEIYGLSVSKDVGY